MASVCIDLMKQSSSTTVAVCGKRSLIQDATVIVGHRHVTRAIAGRRGVGNGKRVGRVGRSGRSGFRLSGAAIERQLIEDTTVVVCRGHVPWGSAWINRLRDGEISQGVGR